MIIKSNSFDNESEHIESVNTDDDESASVVDSQQCSENASKTSKSAEQKRSLLSMDSISMESVNDPDGSISENLVPEKAKKKKRRTLDSTVSCFYFKKMESILSSNLFMNLMLFHLIYRIQYFL